MAPGESVIKRRGLSQRIDGALQMSIGLGVKNEFKQLLRAFQSQGEDRQGLGGWVVCHADAHLLE